MSTSSAPAIGVLPFKGPLARSAKNLQSYVRRKSVSRSARKSAGFKPSGIQQLKAVLEEQAENAPQEAHPRNTERERALQDVLVELLQTEAKYLADLSMVVSAFVLPLQAMLPAQTHYDIFANLQQLEGLHRNLEKDLEPARAAVAASTDGVVATSGGATLADLVARAFQPLLPFFKMYATYCGKYTEAPTKLSEARRKAKVDVFIIAKSAEVGTALEQLLFRPVQRMCVYPLLFKQALNQGRGKEGRGVSEEGLQAFAACFDMVSRTIEEVNENVREQEAEARMRSVLVDQVAGASNLLSPTRKLEHEATVEMTRSNGGWFKALSSGRRPVKWFLFTDLLLVCQAKAFGGGGGAATYHLKVKMDILDIDIAANAAEDEDEFDEENTGRPSMRREPSSGITQPSRWVAATQMILARGIAANDAPAPSTSAPGPTRGSGKRGSTGWSNVLQQAVGRNETLKEDELYGESEKEALHIIHHGRNGGGVYKAWATSESEARELVKQVTLLQAQLRERTQTLKDRKAAARFKGRHIRRTLGSEYGLNQAGLNE